MSAQPRTVLCPAGLTPPPPLGHPTKKAAYDGVIGGGGGGSSGSPPAALATAVTLMRCLSAMLKSPFPVAAAAPVPADLLLGLCSRLLAGAYTRSLFSST